MEGINNDNDIKTDKIDVVDDYINTANDNVITDGNSVGVEESILLSTRIASRTRQ